MCSCLYRVLGALLSAHLIITDSQQPFGDMVPEDYDNELLSLAHDLATRLLPAFENTATGIPFPRVRPNIRPLSAQFSQENGLLTRVQRSYHQSSQHK
jgi:hypothetical protein